MTATGDADIGFVVDVGGATAGVGATTPMLVGVMVGLSNVTPISVGTGTACGGSIGAVDTVGIGTAAAPGAGAIVVEVDDGDGKSVNCIVGKSSAITICQQLSVSATIVIIRATLWLAAPHMLLFRLREKNLIVFYAL